MESKELIEKLKNYRTDYELNQTQMADYLGIGFRTYQTIEKTGIVAKVSVLNSIVQKLRTPFTQIPALHEKQHVYGNENIAVIESQQDAKDYIKNRLAKKNSEAGPFMVPLVPIKAQAGYSKSFSDTDFIRKLQVFPIVPGIDHRGAEWRYFEVEGDSMEETFKEGQYLLASQVIQEDWRNIENFYVYVIVTEEKVMIKRLAKVKGKDYWAAISDNEANYQQFRLPVADVKELWKYRRHIDWDASPPKKFEIKI